MYARIDPKGGFDRTPRTPPGYGPAAPAVVTAKRDSVRHHDVVIFSLTVILSVETESEEALPGEAGVDLRAGVEDLSEVLRGGLR